MKIKCDCTNKQGFTCPKCSRVKMVILLMPDKQNLKAQGPNDKKVNPVWYSPVKQNKWTDDFIAKGMLKRFMSNHLSKHTRMLQFYDQVTGQLIYQAARP